MDAMLTLGYTGAYWEPVTGSYPLGNGYRMYLSDLTRFTMPDDWSPFEEGGVNPYVYCAGDPINHADSSGHLSWFAWLNIGIVAVLPLGSIIDPFLSSEVLTEDAALAGEAALHAAREAVEGEGGTIVTSGLHIGEAEPSKVLSGRLPWHEEGEPGPSSSAHRTAHEERVMQPVAPRRTARNQDRNIPGNRGTQVGRGTPANRRPRRLELSELIHEMTRSAELRRRSTIQLPSAPSNRGIGRSPRVPISDAPPSYRPPAELDAPPPYTRRDVLDVTEPGNPPPYRLSTNWPPDDLPYIDDDF